MTKRRIVVTGLGVVSCFGNDVEHFYAQLLAGKSGVKALTQFPCDDYPTRFAAWIKDFEAGDYVERKLARRADPYINYTMVAGKKALEYAHIDLEKLNRERCGIVIGSGMGGMKEFADGVNTLAEKGPRKVSPFFVPFILPNMGGALLARDIGFMGPNYSIATACATSNNSIIAAANHIRYGETDLMICGGAEAPIIPMGMAGFCACKALSQRNEEPEKASRPWDRARDGFVMGEGCGVIVLESLTHAKARGATILAEYLGGGISCDAHHMTEPRPDGYGIALCIRRALEDSGVQPEEVNFINAHATSTPAGDMVELQATKQVFKDPKRITMNSTKSMIGHSLGAAGGLEAVATVKGIVDGIVHPTANLDDPEPGIEFHIPTHAVEMKIKVALSNSFGFGGHNASVVFAPYHE